MLRPGRRPPAGPAPGRRRTAPRRAGTRPFRIDIRYRDLDPKLQKQLKKLPSEYFGTNITITTSGVFSHQALIDAIQTIGIDNVMFSIDYPFESTGQAAEFMRTAPLAPADKEKAGHANAERILRLKP